MLGDLRHFGNLLTRNARLYGSREGLVMGGERLTWHLAHALRRRGLERGDRVGILAANSIPFLEALFTLARMGLVAVPINGRLIAE